jgi:hypothetical protein
MAKPPASPKQEPSNSPLNFDDIKRDIARRNEEHQKVARQARAIREKAEIARRRQWEQL